jgi:hypothetical protein
MRKTALLHSSRWGLSPAMSRDLPLAEMGNQSGGVSTKQRASAPPPGSPAAAPWGGDAPPGSALFVEIGPRGPAAQAANACEAFDEADGPNPPPPAGEPGPRPEDDASAFAEAFAAATRLPGPKRRGPKRAAAKPCPCYLCRNQPGHPEEGYHRDLRNLLAQLGESQRRWVAALEARRLGFGGTRIVARITGLDEKTVRRGRRELDAAFVDVPARRRRRPAAERRPGGGSRQPPDPAPSSEG